MQKDDVIKLIFLIPISLILLFVAAKRPPFFYGDILKEYAVPGEEKIVTLSSIGKNGQSGKAYISEVGGRVVIKLRLDSWQNKVIQTAFVHKGDCQDLHEVKYYIAPAVEGKSTSTYYGLNLEGLKMEAPLSIVVNKSLEEHGEMVSCGEIEI